MIASPFALLRLWQNAPVKLSMTATKTPAATKQVRVPRQAAPALASAPDLVDLAARRVVEQISAALPSLGFVIVGETISGRIIAHKAASALDAHTAAVAIASCIRCSHGMMSGLETPTALVEDVMIVVEESWHLIRMINNENNYIYISVPISEISLAAARAMLLKCAEALVR